MSSGHPLLNHVTQSLQLFNSQQNICVGLSGGIDSIVLLHILKHITPHLTAIHINHNISANAKTWSEFCQKFCADHNISLHIENINLNRLGGESLENLARIARYKVFLQAPAEIISLAHHQNDQVETTLSQLLRGSDLHNIAAMQIVSKKQGKILWRPLLDVSKAQIEEYAALFGLKYINDESNFDTKFLRNFIRHDVLPLLTSWDNHITTKVLNFNIQLQQVLAITDEISVQDLNFCSTDGMNINIEMFKTLSNIRQINLLSRFIKLNNLPLPSSKQLTEFTKQAITSEYYRKPQLHINDKIRLIKYKQNIYLASI